MSSDATVAGTVNVAMSRSSETSQRFDNNRCPQNLCTLCSSLSIASTQVQHERFRLVLNEVQTKKVKGMAWSDCSPRGVRIFGLLPGPNSILLGPSSCSKKVIQPFRAEGSPHPTTHGREVGPAQSVTEVRIPPWLPKHPSSLQLSLGQCDPLLELNHDRHDFCTSCGLKITLAVSQPSSASTHDYSFVAFHWVASQGSIFSSASLAGRGVNTRKHESLCRGPFDDRATVTVSFVLLSIPQT